MSAGRLAGAGLAATLALSGLVPAAPAAYAAGRPTYLVLTVKLAGAAKVERVTLRCDPPRGTHPAAAKACQAVAAADGRLTALKPATGVMCTMEYAPATAAANGTWRGRPVSYRHTFPNHCLMGVQTGAVFRF